MKTIKEIANDCGLDGLRPTTLANILDGTYTGSTLYEESLYVIIVGQHRRIEKLEAEQAAAIDMLRSVSLDCQTALNADDRITPGDFKCMREGADNVLAQMGAEPPVHVPGEAYRDEWNCPSCGGESEYDGGWARRCHPCGLRFTPAEDAEAELLHALNRPN